MIWNICYPLAAVSRQHDVAHVLWLPAKSMHCETDNYWSCVHLLCKCVVCLHHTCIFWQKCQKVSEFLRVVEKSPFSQSRRHQNCFICSVSPPSYRKLNLTPIPSCQIVSMKLLGVSAGNWPVASFNFCRRPQPYLFYMKCVKQLAFHTERQMVWHSTSAMVAAVLTCRLSCR